MDMSNQNDLLSLSLNLSPSLISITEANPNLFQICTVYPTNESVTNQTQVNNITAAKNDKPVNITPDIYKNKDGIFQGKNGKIYRVLRPEDLRLQMPSDKKSPKRGRPKRIVQEPEQEQQLLNEISNPDPIKVFRTRSGRVSRPSCRIQQQQDCKPLIENQPESTPKDNALQFENKPFSFPTIERKRTISAQYRCGTCNKAYLARSKMKRHLRMYPNHKAPTMWRSLNNDLWSVLLQRAQKEPKNKQARALYMEFESFLYKARNFLPKLLQPDNKNAEQSCYVDHVCSSALGLPEGKYALDEARFLAECNNKCYVDNSSDHENSLHNNDQNSLLSLLDTGQVTFDSVTSSDEVMNVDQLVNERLKTFTGGSDLESTNESQNLNLDLSLDMFSYHAN